MPLPPNHPWLSTTPYNDNSFYLYAVMGASNAIGAMLHDPVTDIAQTHAHNPLFEKKISHHDAVIDFSTPVNSNNTSSYSLLNENGAYSYTARLSCRLREYTRKTVCVVAGGESATPLSVGHGWYASRNAGNPFDMTTRYGQMVTRIQNAQNTTMARCQFIVTNMAGRDAALNVLDSFWLAQYTAMVNDIRSDLNNTNLRFVNIGLGPSPPDAATSYPAWNSIQTAQRQLNTLNNVMNIDPVIDLGISLNTYIQADNVHYNTAGYNILADGIIDRLFG